MPEQQLYKGIVTAARAQTVDSRPGFFVLFFDERPGYEAMAFHSTPC